MMTSFVQRILNLNARLVVKPTLAIVRHTWAMRRLFTFHVMTTQRPLRGLRVRPVTIADRPASICDLGEKPTHGTLLYLHGGAFVMGNLRGYRNLVATLGDRSGQRAVFLKYRLAPEHPFPAALDDAEAAWRALCADPDAGPLTLAGDSAGGNLVLALLQRIIAGDLPRPAAVVAICPITDLRLQNPSLQANWSSDPLVSRRWGARGVASYLDGQDAGQPDASPILGDFTGAPPVLIHTDRGEILHDDARLMADHLRAQGVTVHLTVTEGLYHVWHLNVGVSPEADRSAAEVAAFLRAPDTFPG